MIKCKKQFISIVPITGLTPQEQLNDCLSKLKEILQSFGLDVKNVLKQTVFIKSDDNIDYYDKQNELSSVMKDFYKSFLPPTSFIGQPPENGKHVSLEVILLVEPSDKIEINHEILGATCYSVVNYPDFKEVYAAGLTIGEKNTGTSSQAKGALELMKQVLEKENMTFSEVVRQWNFIEDILGITSDKDGFKQNYQLFNDVRSIYYGVENFINGYPAATGIGMNAGGVIIEFIAISSSKDILIIPISNPRQIDAYRYTQDVLKGDSIKNIPKKTSPKFERAKMVAVYDSGQIYISGTAAVLGQNTGPGQDVEDQTLTTIKNIIKLISRDNLQDCGVKINLTLGPLSYIRVYVKDEAEIPKVKKICEKHFKDVPSLYVVSDICRDDLLVEIEGVLNFSE